MITALLLFDPTFIRVSKYIKHKLEVLAASSFLYWEVIMSKAIRNEKTRGYLDKLQKQRETRKQIRDLKSFDWLTDIFPDEYLNPAEIWANIPPTMGVWTLYNT